ncbi:MAG: extracellular solute-binding protein [Lachnospiraceae bacterium]|nr:extracellular solute-binding protein [Lachnospiraceae bacterium]MCM1239289.1 extracellular solute-binding protein [Lachnospiraceae bacterium]
MKRTGIYCLISCLILCLTGCGADGGQDQAVQENMADDSASSYADAGDGQTDTPDNSADDQDDRQVLSVVIAMPFRDTTDKVIAYNESSPSYYIDARLYGGGVKMAEILDTKLTLEILSGKGPDLVIWDQDMYTPSLASEKLMENLYDFMDADPDFHKEDYYENILQAFEIDGGLYVLPASFSVDTGCVRAEELEAGKGIAEGWELGEMMAAYENSSLAERFCTNFTKESMISAMCRGCMGNFIDWGSGECHFDTPEFVRLLEWCNTFPEEYVDFNPVEFYRSGKIFWRMTRLFTPWDTAFAREISGDADILWPGYPVADGEQDLGGGVAEPFGMCFSICRNSSNKDAAWDFIKTWLTEDMQREVRGIPLLRSVSEERIQDALTPEYETVDGVEQEKIKYETAIVITEGVEEPIRLSCITESDAEVYRSIIENTHRGYDNNPGVLDIILEEAGACFGGDKDAAEAADIIQNRVSIYVGERID